MRVMLYVIGWLLLAAGGLPAQERGDKPEPLPEAVVEAWKKAGAEVGWMGPHPLRRNVVFREELSEELDLTRTGPAFWIFRWRERMWKELPMPTKGFGMSVGDDELRDAGLKELAALKQLTSLSLYRARVTDAGLNLALWTRRREAGKPADLAAVQPVMLHWQKDPDLAGIRDKDVLANLPADEQKAFPQLWADVAALLKKAGGQPGY